MSSSKTALEREQGSATTQPDSAPGAARPDERRGVAGYPTGRESQREFPRRSSSECGGSGSQPTEEGHRPAGRRYDSLGYEAGYGAREPYREEGYGRNTYDDLASGRADREDLPRYRGGERAYNYDHSDYRAERRDYDELGNRHTLAGHDDAENDYPETPYDRF